MYLCTIVLTVVIGSHTLIYGQIYHEEILVRAEINWVGPFAQSHPLITIVDILSFSW